MKTTYVYGVWDLEISKFVYIGKSNAPCERFKDHMKCADNAGLREFVEERGTGSFELIILEKIGFSVSREWGKREKFWIKKFREEGHPLCNKNDGGGGLAEHTEETIVKMSEATKKYYETHVGYWTDKHHTEETKTKISRASSGENHSMFGEHHTEEAKAKIGKANIGNEYSAKPHPAFYNTSTGEYIPEGINLAKMCREYGLSCDVMGALRRKERTLSNCGWKLSP